MGDLQINWYSSISMFYHCACAIQHKIKKDGLTRSQRTLSLKDMYGRDREKRKMRCDAYLIVNGGTDEWMDGL